MVSERKIRGRIVENGLTIAALSKKMGLTPFTLGRKISNRAPITLDEARYLQIVLKITDKEFGQFFFAQEIAKCNKWEGKPTDE